MHRRDFLRIAGLATPGLLLPAAVSRAFAQSPTERWRTYEVTTRVEVLNSAGRTRASSFPLVTCRRRIVPSA